MNDEKALAEQQTVQERVSERIQQEFMSLVSEEEWKRIVSDEIAKFIQVGVRDRYDNVTPGPLRQMIRDALTVEARKHIANVIDEMNIRTYGPEPNELVKQIVIECAPELFGTAMAAVVQNALMNFRQQMAQNVQNTY